MKLTKYISKETQGLELYIDEKTGLAYTHERAIARIFEKDTSRRTIQRRLRGGSNYVSIEAEFQSGQGTQGGSFYNAEVVYDLAFEFNPELAKAMGKAGANVYLCGLAGYKVTVQSPTEEIDPIVLAENFIRAETERRRLAAENRELMAETERQAEVIDELFGYSSIIRIAKFNGCSEKAFNWRTLKAASTTLDVEIKKVPCPRYQTKNLYSHEAWKLAYPDYALPEATTIALPVLNQETY